MKLADFFAAGFERELKKDEVIFTPDETCGSVGYVVSGKLMMKKYLPGGKELRMTEFLPGDMFGELLALAGGNYRGWLIAEEPSRIRELGRLELISLLNKEQFRQFYFNEISRRVTKMTEKIEILSHQKILDRLVLFLLQQNRGSGPFRFNVTGTAEVLDCSREALSRALSELESTGAVRREGHMIIIEDLLLGP